MKYGTPLVDPAEPFVPGQLDNLGQTTFAPGVSWNFGFTPQNPYTAIIVNALALTTGRMLCATVRPIGGAFPRFSAVAAGLDIPTDYQAVVPCFGMTPGTFCDGGVFFSGANPGGTLELWGVTSPCPVPVRSDGRAYPLGQLFAANTLSAANGPIPLIAAPISPLRVFLSRILANNVATTGTQIVVQGTINGALQNLHTIRTGAAAGDGQLGFVEQSTPQGLLLDPATGVQLAGSASPIGDCTLFYDLIN